MTPASSAAPRRRKRKSKTKTILAGVLLLALAAGAVGGYYYTLAPKQQRADLILYTTRLEPMQLTVVERGTLESADNREVTCRVKAGTKTAALSIKWVIDDGAEVKAGERLVEIDDSALQDQLKAEKILLDQARSAWISSEEQFKITRSLNESTITNAEIAVITADINLRKYIEGDYQQALKQAEGDIKNARADLEIQRERVAWAERAATRDYLSDGQYKAEKSKFDSLQINLDQKLEARRVLNEYTKVLETTTRENTLAEAKRALERAKNEAKAKEIQAESDRQAKKSVFEQEQDKYDDIEEQIRKCLIYSPQDGMVVYYISDQSRYGSGSQQSIIAQGETVKEGQKLMRIPDLRHMLVNTKVHEAMVSRIKGDVWKPTGFPDALRASLLVQPDGLSRYFNMLAMPDIRERLRDHELQKVSDGMRATVRIDAFPDQVLHGHVKSVATVAAQQDWMSADIKNYQTMVSIDESLEGLKPGMSAEVTIHVESAEQNVLTVPIQAVFGGVELGQKRKVFVNAPDGPKERDVTIGLANEKVVEVKDGINEGDVVVLNPKAILGDKAKTRQVIDNGRGSAGDGKGKGKGNKPGRDAMPPGMGGGGAPPGGAGAPAVKEHK
jgi:multidrug efflux pump subunit AcrA (membrane-fusion protein)